MVDRPLDAVIEAAKQGNEAAWSEIFRRLAPGLLGYLRANGAPEPEDALGDVLLQVARDLHGFEGGERAFRAWVYVIAYHRILDARRYFARRPSDPVAEPPEPTTAPVTDAADQALAQISSDEVKALLATLSPDQRDVLTLRVLGGLTINEVAEVLGKRAGAIKQLQRRGLTALREQLESGAVTL